MKIYDCFKLNEPHVIHEVIDGEAVLVNMENGFYYSLDDAGADIWNLIEKGNSVIQIENILNNQYDATSKEIKDGLAELIQSLLDEELIVGLDTPKIALVPDNGTSNDASGKKRFKKPTLQKYTDMEDLLLLDPIHDVDEEAGWPNKTA